MATNPTGINGALFDPVASNGLGALCTGIGFGTNAVYNILPAGITDGKTIGAVRIGGTAALGLQACGSPGKAVIYRTANAPAAPGAAVPPSTDLNKSGKAMVAGQSVLAVAA